MAEKDNQSMDGQDSRGRRRWACVGETRANLMGQNWGTLLILEAKAPIPAFTCEQLVCGCCSLADSEFWYCTMALRPSSRGSLGASATLTKPDVFNPNFNDFPSPFDFNLQ